MNDREQARILSDCLAALASGATVADCLARYPEQAGELAPMLGAALEVRALGSHDLSPAARLRARGRLRQAQVAYNRRTAQNRWWRPFPGLAGARALAASVALVLFLVFSGVVAASHPGDLAYGLRTEVEEIPAYLASGSRAQSQARMSLAERRLVDLELSLSGPAPRLDPRTIASLLANEDQAAGLAQGLPAAEQAAIAKRLAAQARRLAQLAQAARQPQDAHTLRTAAGQASRTAERVRANMPDQPGEPSPQMSPSRTPIPGRTSGGRPEPTATAASIPTVPSPSPVPTDRPATAAPAAPAGQRREMGSATPQGTALPANTAGPRAGASATAALGPGPETTPAGPGPQATAPGPGPEATPSGDGAATPAGPGPVPEAPGPAPTSSGPGPGPDGGSQGPGAAGTSQEPEPAPPSPEPQQGGGPRGRG